MSTYNIHFHDKIKKILKYPSECVSWFWNSQGKAAIGVQAIEVLLHWEEEHEIFDDWKSIAKF